MGKLLRPIGEAAGVAAPAAPAQAALKEIIFETASTVSRSCLTSASLSAGSISPARPRMLSVKATSRLLPKTGAARAFGQTRATFDGPDRMRRENGFRQDRSLMRSGHFTGVPTLALEDSLVCVSAGPLRDRSRERLSTADLAIAYLYRHLIKSAKRVRDGGEPLGFGVSLANIVGVNAKLKPDEDWRKLVAGHYQVAPLSAAVG
jgi:hypothetical protein